ncbi:hypothetical protein ACS3UN_09920 [Oscillospiraceae bacterium LTW-04]|nr:hypothetical protein RBH76_11670 [Oscillospiraceae bacterium MB24-C1]
MLTAPKITHDMRLASLKGCRTIRRKRLSSYFKRLFALKSIFLAETARARLKRIFTITGLIVMLLPAVIHIVYLPSRVSLVLLGLFLIGWGRWQL